MQHRHGQINGALDVLLQGGAVDFAILNLFGRGIDSDGQGQRLEEAEQGTQLMFNDQSMALAATSGSQQHRRAVQGIHVDQIEQVLEQARNACAKDGRAHDQKVGLLNGLDGLMRMGGQGVGGQGRAQFGQQADQLDVLHVQCQLIVQCVAQRVQQYLGAGGTVQASIHNNGFQRAAHGNSLQ